MNFKVWIVALNQSFFVASIGVGGNILFSKYRHKEESIMTTSLIVPISIIIFGIICSITNFCFLGNFSKNIGIPIDKLPINGSDLAFVTYPAALNLLPWPNFWSIIFFTMLVTLGIDTQFTFAEQVSYYLHKFVLSSRGYDKFQSASILCAINTIFGIIFCFGNGIYIFEIFDNYVTLFSLFIISVVECLILGHYIGEEKLQKMSIEYTNETIPEYFIQFYRVYYPVIGLLFVFLSFIKLLHDSEHYTVTWPLVLKIFIIVFPMIPMFYYYITEKDEVDEKEVSLS